MANERLRSSVAARGMTLTDVATHVEVDPKTVERWVSNDRLPHRGHRSATAKLLGVDEAYLWPQVLNDAEVRQRILSVEALRAATTALRLYLGNHPRGPFDA